MQPYKPCMFSDCYTQNFVTYCAGWAVFMVNCESKGSRWLWKNQQFSFHFYNTTAINEAAFHTSALRLRIFNPFYRHKGSSMFGFTLTSVRSNCEVFVFVMVLLSV